MEELITAIVNTSGGNPLFLFAVLLVAKDFYQQVSSRNRGRDDSGISTALSSLAEAHTKMCGSIDRQTASIDRQTERIDAMSKEISEILGRIR